MDNSNPQALAAAASALNEGEALVEQLLGLVGGLVAQDGERRLRDRYSICCKMLVVPLDACGQQLTQEIVTVFGKDLSRRGISFSHDNPLASKRCNISFLLGENSEFVVEAEVTWSKRTLIGLYESGCRLIRKIAGPKVATAC